MHVSLHQSFKGYIEGRPEENLYRQVLENINVSVADFEADDRYHDDAEMDHAIEAAASILSKSRDDVLTDWGLSAAKGLLAQFESAVDPEWTVLDLLEHIEGRMHTFVREQFDARPPVLKTTRLSPNELRIEAETTKQMTGLGTGFVLGFAEKYGEKVTLDVDDRPDGFTMNVVTAPA